jgi:hypothetical protein
MPRRPCADDDEDFNACLGLGSIGELRDQPTRGKRVRHPIGFVHFPDKPRKKTKAARARKQKRRRR